jgi:hypothetical protein
MHAPGGDLHQEQHINAGQPDRVDVQKSQARIPFAWTARNSVQVGPDRRGAGSIPALVGMDYTLLAATW